MEGLKLIAGEILIPMDPRQKVTLEQLRKPSGSIFRAVLHQGELALIYFMVHARLEPVVAARPASPQSQLSPVSLSGPKLSPQVLYSMIEVRPSITSQGVIHSIQQYRVKRSP